MDAVDGKIVRSRWLASTVSTPLAMLIPGLAFAQVITDGSTGPGGALSGPDYQITDDLGTRAGDNLFHSFRAFSIGTGESATFSGPDEIENVISRVTGPNPSDIDGALRSTMPEADFYFINPNGVTFGPNARVDVQGSFHVSTADELRFEGGEVFSAVSPDASGFAVAEPRAFGFFDADPGAILVDGSTLDVDEGETLSLVGGDITVDGGEIRTETGAINLFALAGESEADFAEGAVKGSREGNITLTNESKINTSGDGTGSIRVRGGNLSMAKRSTLTSNNLGSTNSQGGISIDVKRLKATGASQIRADVEGAGAGAIVSVTADDIFLSGFDPENQEVTLIGSQVSSTGSGIAPDVIVHADNAIEVRDSAQISGETFGASDAASVRVSADSIKLSTQGVIASFSSSGSNAGDVLVAATSVDVIGDGTGALTGIASQSRINSTGNAGLVDIHAHEMHLKFGGGQVNADSFGSGNAGSVAVEVEDLLIEGDFSRFPAGITSSSQSLASGDSGNIIVQAKNIDISRGGQIKTNTNGIGNTGSIEIDTETLSLDSAGRINTSNFASGSEVSSELTGDVLINVTKYITMESPEIDQVSGINTATVGERNAGDIVIKAPVLLIGPYSLINSSTVAGNGNGGDIEIDVDDLIVDSSNDPGNSGIATIPVDSFNFSAGIDIPINPDLSGNAGNITITANNSLVMNAGVFLTATFTSGRGGDINIYAGSIALDSSLITTASFGLGDTGNITMLSDKSITFDDSFVSSESQFGGGGNIDVVANSSLDLQDSFMRTSVFGGAGTAAGNINTRSQFLILDKGFVLANAIEGQGGAISVTADKLIISPGSLINAQAGPAGIDGTVATSSPEVDLSGSLLALDSQFADASRLIRESCESGGDVGGSTFTSSGQPLTVAPGDGLMPGFKPDTPLPGQLNKGNAEPTALPCP